MLDDAQKAVESQAELLNAAAAAPISVVYSSAVGTAMVLSSAMIAAINIAVIKTLFSAKELYRLSSYKFIIGIGVSSVIQLCVELIAGVLTLFRTNGAANFNRLLAAVIFSAYIFYLLLTLVLALNRLVIVISPFVEFWLFGKTGVRIWLTLCTMIAIIYCGFLMSPIMGVFYAWEILSFDCIYSLPLSYGLDYYKSMIERWGSYAVTCIYLVIFAVIRTRRRRNANLQEQRGSSGTADAKLLIQSFAIAADCLILNVFWYYCEDFLPLVFSSTIGSLSFLNFLWIYSCAVNPIVYFLLNSTVRQRIMRMFSSKCDTKPKVLATVVTCISFTQNVKVMPKIPK